MINHSGATVAMSRHDAAASNAEDDEFCLVIQKPSDPFTEESRTSFYKHHLPGFSRLGCTASTRYTDEIDFRSEMSDQRAVEELFMQNPQEPVINMILAGCDFRIERNPVETLGD